MTPSKAADGGEFFWFSRKKRKNIQKGKKSIRERPTEREEVFNLITVLTQCGGPLVPRTVIATSSRAAKGFVLVLIHSLFFRSVWNE